MKTLYFDCFAGASGNMILGGLISLGIEPKQLTDEIEKLNISEFEIEFEEVNRSGINAVHAKTIYQEETRHRHFSNIQTIIEESGLSTAVKSRAIEIFKNLAKAEAKVHGIEFEKVHFHEVGAMDAIIDVVGACIGFEILEVEKFLCSKIHVGSGFVNIAHGKYPIPPPAVAELLNGIPIYSTEILGELTTPTGAAIISTICEGFGEINDFQSEIIGYGAGTREYEDFPNALRMMIGKVSNVEPKEKIQPVEKTSSTNNEVLTLVETNLDDISPEILGFVMEKAFKIGALDCWFTPIQMKKNRPATLVSILCEQGDKEKFADLLYTETSTIGIRINRLERECLEREVVTFQTEFGEVEAKIASHKNKVVNIKPEFETLRRIALESGDSVIEIEQKIIGYIREKIGEN